MIGKLDQALGFHETALRLRSQRQQVLASNIANADTPNFKARDFNFAAALQESVGRVAGAPVAAPALATTAPGHRQAAALNLVAGSTPLLYRTGGQGGVDGNTVDMDVERNQFADNALRYEAGVTMISGQIKSLLTAIQG